MGRRRPPSEPSSFDAELAPSFGALACEAARGASPTRLAATRRRVASSLPGVRRIRTTSPRAKRQLVDERAPVLTVRRPLPSPAAVVHNRRASESKSRRRRASGGFAPLLASVARRFALVSSSSSDDDDDEEDGDDVEKKKASPARRRKATRGSSGGEATMTRVKDAEHKAQTPTAAELATRTPSPFKSSSLSVHALSDDGATTTTTATASGGGRRPLGRRSSATTTASSWDADFDSGSNSDADADADAPVVSATKPWPPEILAEYLSTPRSASLASASASASASGSAADVVDVERLVARARPHDLTPRADEAERASMRVVAGYAAAGPLAAASLPSWDSFEREPEPGPKSKSCLLEKVSVDNLQRRPMI